MEYEEYGWCPSCVQRAREKSKPRGEAADSFTVPGKKEPIPEWGWGVG